MDNDTYQPIEMTQISHELRIPLMGILGMANLLYETFLSPQQKEYLEVIQLSAKRLLSLESELRALIKKKNKHI